MLHIFLLLRLLRGWTYWMILMLILMVSNWQTANQTVNSPSDNVPLQLQERHLFHRQWHRKFVSHVAGRWSERRKLHGPCVPSYWPSSWHGHPTTSWCWCLHSVSTVFLRGSGSWGTGFATSTAQWTQFAMHSATSTFKSPSRLCYSAGGGSRGRGKDGLFHRTVSQLTGDCGFLSFFNCTSLFSFFASSERGANKIQAQGNLANETSLLFEVQFLRLVAQLHGLSLNITHVLHTV